ncbi:MAG TPA: hypothetical protein VMG31_01985 [Verrucomicrobiae bacterium]|nr:hypothetical protein [Verrucomicrobiae bacterium]
MILKPHRRPKTSPKESGYILLSLLLMVALMTIFAVAIIPSIKYQVEHDREEELIHRGVQYSRAIRLYYKKFGRYPTKLEDLENTNNLRFLRKRYKDPMTGKDFRLLHFGEVKLTFTGGIGGGTIPGASPAGAPMTTSGAGALGQVSTFGGNGGFGNNSGSSFSSSTSSSAAGQNPSASTSDTSQNPGQNAGSGQTGSDDSSSSSSGQSGSGQVIGGGPIVGVVSNAKCPPRPKDDCEGFREFNHKRKYNEWQFIYDPGTDQGGLLMTPNQPPLMGTGQTNLQNGNGQNGSTSNGFGTSGFGTGTQNNPNQPAPTSPTPPGNNPQ